MASRDKWLRESLVPALVAQNWPKSTVVHLEVGARQGGNVTDGGFASTTFRLLLRVKNNDNEQDHHLLAKESFEDPRMREMVKANEQFENEARWYRDVIPILRKLGKNYEGATLCDNLAPKHFFSLQQSAEHNIIIMQDLKHEGFELAHQPAASLDAVHASLAIERLAHLHALSYTLKSQEPGFYRNYIQNLHETWYIPENKAYQDKLQKITIQRGLNLLRQRSECSELVSEIANTLGDSPFSVHTAMIRPRNSNTDVICHGDFCRNNILFKYDSNGVPCDVRLIDFAIMREASPGVDISFFLYLSVSEEAVEGEGLRQLLSHYHASLVTALAQLGGPEDPWRGNLDKLEREVGCYSLLSYCICSFFLPVMMDKPSAFSVEDRVNLSVKEFAEANLQMGGEATTQRLGNILLDIQKRGFHKLWKKS